MTDWRFILAHTPTFSLIGELPARGKKLDIALNKPGSASCSIPLDHIRAYDVDELNTSLLAVRNGMVVWSGPVWQASVDAPSNKLNITAMGWFEELNKRIIRGAYTNLASTVVPTQAQTFTNVDAGVIIKALVDKANAQRDMQHTPRATHITTPADYPMSQVRTRDYAAGQSIGGSILELTQVEAGVDIYVDPVTRVLHVKYDLVVDGSTIRGIGVDRPEVVLGFNWGPKNLQAAGYTADAGRMCNRMVAAGPFGSGIAEDRDAMDETGFMFEEQTSLSDVKNDSLLLAYAGAEVAVRALPQKIYDVSPFPSDELSSAVAPFDDFNVGDVVRMSARQGAWSEDRKAVRIFGLTIDIDDNGNERISSLQTTAS